MWLWCAQGTIVIVVVLHKSHMKHNKLAFIPLQNWIIFVFFFFLFNFQAFCAYNTPMAPEFKRKAIDDHDDEKQKVCKWWFVVGRELK